MDDPLEREADRAADAVLAGTAADFSRIPITVQRHGQAGAPVAEAPASVHRALAGPGRPLDAAVRRDFEPRFGRDFSQVRIHDGAAADESARAIAARAYTVGTDIVFRSSGFAPASGEGRRLLAHELTHVGQQGSGGLRLRRTPEPGAGDAPPEREGADTLPEPEEADRLFQPDEAPAQLLDKGKPLSAEAEALAKELEQLFADTEWERIRDRLYAPASADNMERARQRRARLLPDMKGLGAIKAVDEFAAKVRQLQADWPNLKTADERAMAIETIVNAQLGKADVYPIKKVRKAKMPEHANFNSKSWEMKIKEALLSDKPLGEDEAALLANTLMHECRHAEQAFLAARFAAKRGDTAAEIAEKHDMYSKAAEAAVARKFDSTTDKETRKLGRKMFRWGALQGNRTEKRTEALRVGINKKLRSKRAAADRAAKALRARETKGSLERATKALDALKKILPQIERMYERYRGLREEADAHEVGDAEEVAFRASK